MSITRRSFLQTLGGLALTALPSHAQHNPLGAQALRQADGCGEAGPGRPLFIPGDRGFLGRLALDDEPLTLRVGRLRQGKGDLGRTGLTQAYFARHRGREFVNPTFVLQPGQRVRIALENRIAEATIVHWHGLAVDTHNDGAGMALAAPGARYAYDFEVRNRGALYWYHPHPHGLTAGQAYRGLFGQFEVTDGDEQALRAALDLAPGKSEIPLLLQDRRRGDYAASAADRMHGFFGDTVLVNGTACPYLDVATRLYRFRILNASNARTFRLGWRTVSGAPLPFTLIGNDGGLLPAPQTCAEAFLASAERLDMLLDLRDVAVGDTLFLDTRGFDPMHIELPAAAPEGMPGMDHAAMGPAMPAPATSTAPASAVDHAAMGPSDSFPEGALRALLQLRVRERIAYTAKVPALLSTPPPIDASKASERPLRLGFAKNRWRINDRVFALGETPIEVVRNTVEIWLIRNYFSSMPHAMHLHGFGFEVLERQTSPDPVAALKVDERGRLPTDFGRKDTVLVWPGETVRIAVDFSCPFAGAQTYMFHCHNLEHEDGGMMLGVKVV
jgi:suppressor of ftsI/bilirubin oxidase